MCLGDQVTLSLRSVRQLLDTVVGGQVSYRFATNGGFVNDPNLRPKHRITTPWQAGNSIQAGQCKLHSTEAVALHPHNRERTQRQFQHKRQ